MIIHEEVHDPLTCSGFTIVRIEQKEDRYTQYMREMYGQGAILTEQRVPCPKCNDREILRAMGLPADTVIEVIPVERRAMFPKSRLIMLDEFDGLACPATAQRECNCNAWGCGGVDNCTCDCPACSDDREPRGCGAVHHGFCASEPDDDEEED